MELALIAGIAAATTIGGFLAGVAHTGRHIDRIIAHCSDDQVRDLLKRAGRIRRAAHL